MQNRQRRSKRALQEGTASSNIYGSTVPRNGHQMIWVTSLLAQVFLSSRRRPVGVSMDSVRWRVGLLEI
eukprot:6187793-Pleurochrysis_carterae.AAC.1